MPDAVPPSTDSPAPVGHAGGRPDLIRLGEPIAIAGPLVALTRPDVAMLVFGLAVYSATRLWALEQYPIFFFTDEAAHPNLAARLLANGLRDHLGTFLPPYFQNDDRWNLSLSVYLHLVPVALFGKSIVVARATSAVISVAGVLATALALRVGFQSRSAGLAVLVLGGFPAWFLHSRTAFEVVFMVSFYACFLCAYLLYRYRSPRFIYAALIFGAATFYSYANGPLVMLATGGLLALSDLGFHLRQSRRLQVGAVTLTALLALPFLRFRWLHPEAIAYQMDVVGSYWQRDLPLAEKLVIFGRTYWEGISPANWFLPNQVDLVRHQMDGLGHIPIFLLPFCAVGLGLCLHHWRSSAHRVILIALVAAPAAALLTTVYVTRGMAIVVPATMLACLGFGWIAQGVARRSRGRLSLPAVAIVTAVLLGAWNLYLLRAALTDGPTWSTHYGLSGMQFGASQVFGAIRDELRADPDLEMLLSPDWTNNANALEEFFLEPELSARLKMGNLDGWLVFRSDLDPAQVNVLPAESYERARASAKLVVGPPLRVIPYPDGRPGFYFVRMRYADDVDAQFAADEAAMQRTDEGTVFMDGRRVAVVHSLLDSGRLEDLVDGEPETYLRGASANPFILDLRFPEPRTVGGIRLHTSDMDLTLKVVASPAGGGAPRVAEVTSRDLTDEPRIDLDLPGGPVAIDRLRLEILDLSPRLPKHIHVRDLGLR